MEESDEDSGEEEHKIDVAFNNICVGTGSILLLTERIRQELFLNNGFHGSPKPTAENKLQSTEPFVCAKHRALGVSVTFRRCEVYPVTVEVALQNRIAQVSEASARDPDPTRFLLETLPRRSQNGPPLLYSPQIRIGLLEASRHIHAERVVLTRLTDERDI